MTDKARSIAGNITDQDGWLKRPLSLQGKRIFVAGHRGLVGAALMRRLQSEGGELLTAARDDLDLRDYAATARWMERARRAVGAVLVVAVA